jgi:hypothetical protein
MEEDFKMNILEKIKEWFGFKKETKVDKELNLVDEFGTIASRLISFSDASYMSSLAARICIGQGPEEDYQKRLEHIGRVVGRGHESTIAHSNIIILLVIDKPCYGRFLEIAEGLRFIDYSVSEIKEEDKFAILLGGSVRAYKYFFREVKDLSNPICISIKEILYQSVESVFFEDLIADGIMDKDSFSFYPMGENNVVTEEVTGEDGNKEQEQFCEGTIKEPTVLKGKTCDIIYADDVYGILDKVEQYGFTLRDVLKLTICSVFFHDVSRVVSHQLVRHLAAISQLSQRYVDCSASKFIDPLQFNEKYDVNKQYVITLGDNKYEMPLKSFGDLLMTAPAQLIEQGMLKQDTRSIAPMNIDTKLLMTFTFSRLIHFIKERDCDAAQPEIHVSAKELVDNLYAYDLTSYLFTSNGIDNLIKLCETPVYKAVREADFAKDDMIDEVLEEEIENE